MNYQEFMVAVLDGRDVRVVADKLEMSTQQLENYCRSRNIPGYVAAIRLANEAGLGTRLDLVFSLLAAEELRKKNSEPRF